MFESVFVVDVVTKTYDVMVVEAIRKRFSRACSMSEKMPFWTRYSSVLDEAISTGRTMASLSREREETSTVASTL